jgi:hypothetical protein
MFDYNHTDEIDLTWKSDGELADVMLEIVDELTIRSQVPDGAHYMAAAILADHALNELKMQLGE